MAVKGDKSRHSMTAKTDRNSWNGGQWSGASGYFCVLYNSCKAQGHVSSPSVVQLGTVICLQPLSIAPEENIMTLHGVCPWKIIFSIGLVAYYPVAVGRKLFAVYLSSYPLCQFIHRETA